MCHRMILVNSVCHLPVMVYVDVAWPMTMECEDIFTIVSFRVFVRVTFLITKSHRDVMSQVHIVALIKSKSVRLDMTGIISMSQILMKDLLRKELDGMFVMFERIVV